MYFFHSKPLEKVPVMVCVIYSHARIIRQSYDNFSYRISNSDCLSQNTSETMFSRSKALKVKSCQGVPKIRSSDIIQRSCGNFFYIDYQIQNTSGTKFSRSMAFKVSPYQDKTNAKANPSDEDFRIKSMREVRAVNRPKMKMRVQQPQLIGGRNKSEES
ncbi:hypothetical protein TNCV_3158531 [Trichonephila clavipes]|nr:hypothetical protein TNCV_3158531 [Trichonephila clavipes]